VKIFSPLYDRALRWSRHPHAERYLAGISFTESSFFPIPPDVLLAPMTLAQPKRWWGFAALTTVASVLGGLLGYVFGYAAIEAVEPLLHRVGYWEHFQTAHAWFEHYGFWAILAAGFTPIPYKVFTIAGGVFQIDFREFLLASALGRSGRFFLVGGLIRVFGPPVKIFIDKYFNLLSILFVVLLLGGFLLVRWVL